MADTIWKRLNKSKLSLESIAGFQAVGSDPIGSKLPRAVDDFSDARHYFDSNRIHLSDKVNHRISSILQEIRSAVGHFEDAQAYDPPRHVHHMRAVSKIDDPSSLHS